MLLNPYQKIIKDDVEIQAGDMNTSLKFVQLTGGIELKDKRVLDVGCNLGMMCHLARQQGAIATGIDINRDYIDQAKDIFPDIGFICRRAEDISGNYDIIIASALLHYVRDLDEVLNAFARCSKQVICDVWLNDSPEPIFTLSHRDIYIPSRTAFLNIAGKYFKNIKEGVEALSPDSSRRYVFHLSEPTPRPAEAILIYGEGDTGKTTLAQTYFDHIHLMTDNIFGSWRYENRSMMLSVKWFSNLARGNYRQEYIDYFINLLREWLKPCVNRDIVVEGYDLMFGDFRSGVIKLLDGWRITEIERK